MASETCPTCGQTDRVRELPQRDGRRERKMRRTGRAALMVAIRDGMHLWECARCDRAWHTHDERST